MYDVNFAWWLYARHFKVRRAYICIHIVAQLPPPPPASQPLMNIFELSCNCWWIFQLKTDCDIGWGKNSVICIRYWWKFIVSIKWIDWELIYYQFGFYRSAVYEFKIEFWIITVEIPIKIATIHHNNSSLMWHVQQHNQHKFPSIYFKLSPQKKYV